MVGQNLSRYRDSNVRVVNASRGGMTARVVAGNLPTIPASTVAVVVELGGNDLLLGGSRGTIMSHLTTIVKHCQHAEGQPAVFVMQIMPGDLEAEVAEKTGIRNTPCAGELNLICGRYRCTASACAIRTISWRCGGLCTATSEPSLVCCVQMVRARVLIVTGRISSPMASTPATELSL